MTINSHKILPVSSLIKDTENNENTENSFENKNNSKVKLKELSIHHQYLKRKQIFLKKIKQQQEIKKSFFRENQRGQLQDDIIHLQINQQQKTLRSLTAERKL
ncbi:hypothetical protein PPERSA_02681 [Pseudocohnilembus persalinus]|uniref:Uncharacterized protein n=1 Tax=Pseudocohnilembus persalinus TaxID=266149 RepID=A0A0V0R5N9_PSEPJ|nr:hypothetical protein PPERSA_02681 [Pseudocohnilembus persalinus]|eukprot:KRX09809.1 hypothetical protein PPERSA_02681 [Pseudocohnilembus persalinus]